MRGVGVVCVLVFVCVHAQSWAQLGEAETAPFLPPDHAREKADMDQQVEGYKAFGIELPTSVYEAFQKASHAIPKQHQTQYDPYADSDLDDFMDALFEHGEALGDDPECHDAFYGKEGEEEEEEKPGDVSMLEVGRPRKVKNQQRHVESHAEYAEAGAQAKTKSNAKEIRIVRCMRKRCRNCRRRCNNICVARCRRRTNNPQSFELCRKRCTTRCSNGCRMRCGYHGEQRVYVQRTCGCQAGMTDADIQDQMTNGDNSIILNRPFVAMINPIMTTVEPEKAEGVLSQESIQGMMQAAAASDQAGTPPPAPTADITELQDHRSPTEDAGGGVVPPVPAQPVEDPSITPPKVATP